MLTFGRLKPKFMILGVQKGGTTSLHEYLIQHPCILGPKKKELHFFDSFQPLNIDDYHKNFPFKLVTNKITFESTPRYIYYPNVAKKIYDYNPNMKFIVVLRDPVKRAYSAWNMYKQMGESERMINFFKKNEKKSPKEIFFSLLYRKETFPSFLEMANYELDNELNIDFIEPSIIRRGYYKKQIDTYLEYFNLENFLFIDSSSLKNDTLEVLNTIATFLNISNFKSLDLDLEMKHQRVYSEPLNVKIYDELLLHFQNKNKGLEELVNLKFEWMRNKVSRNV
ncbi:sulfotransferase domain-containing protein [Winogradskyella sediminis]|uniref:sulfotransferase domain-containing protein n=1 Tax=Winogradskyella sediminis TaxID=1382466 RepID=UPI000E23C10E|nr:sulfotransferase domain-containing protein [Winogradskyella sediminis]REG87710.1 sulfotransferase domain-containing protein [Winogradskyella sediminis]